MALKNTHCYRVEVRTTNVTAKTFEDAAGNYLTCEKCVCYVTTNDPALIWTAWGESVKSVMEVGIGYHIIARETDNA